MLKKILLGTTLVLAASFANSATIVQNIIQDFPFADDQTNFSKSFDYYKFDDMGGTRILESVSFEMSGRANGTGGAMNLHSTQASDYTATLNVALLITDESGLFAGVDLVETEQSTLVGGGSTDFLSLSAADSNGFVINTTSLLPDYVGMGTRTAVFDSVATSTFTGSGNIASNFGTEAGADIRIIYTYSEVPTSVSSPSHIALLGLGLISLAGMRFRKK